MQDNQKCEQEITNNCTYNQQDGFLYHIHEKKFPYGTDHHVMFRVRNIKTKESLEISAVALFQNDDLLTKFSPLDIREIVYAAAMEIFLAERDGITELKKNEYKIKSH